MNRIYPLILVVSIAAFVMDCSEDSKNKFDAGDVGQFSEVDSETEAAESDEGSLEDAGDVPIEGCPAGMQCAAIAGSFVCAEPSTGTPPRCGLFTGCDVGQCTWVGALRYCIKDCAPETVMDCPSGSECEAPAGYFLCSLPETGSPPLCNEGNACEFGECILFEGTTYCIQPCDFPVVTECPDNYACLSVNGLFLCTSKNTGSLDTCNTTEDCAHGKCVHTLGQGYCVLRCEESLVDECAEGATCRYLDGVFACALDSTQETPTCAESSPCEWGECVTLDGNSSCIQYCTDPLIEISGSVVDMDQAPLSGVEVCPLEDGLFPCVTSDEEGAFLLTGLPQQDYYALTFTLEGYQPVLQLAFAFAELQSIMLLSDEQTAAAMTEANATYPETDTGSVIFSATTLNDQGELVPLSGYGSMLDPSPAVSLGPVYANEEQILDMWLTTSTAAGWGAYFNVTPGDYFVYFGHPSLFCLPIPVQVVAGYQSSAMHTQCW